MKKLITFMIALGAVFTLSACGTGATDITTEELLSSEESLATLSYLTAGFLDFGTTPTVSTGITFLANGDNGAATKIEGELDEVNVYFDRLKAIIDNGVDSFGSITEEVSDNELYDYKITFTVNEEVYVIYYSIDEVTAEMTGIIVVGDQEYAFEVVDNMKEYRYQEEEKYGTDDDADTEDETDTEDDADNEDPADTEDPEDVDDPEDDVDTEDESDDETETKMMLIATSGEDTIKIMYKTETSDDETETKFDLEQTINGETKEVSIKISQEEDEYKVTISEGEDEYSFKREIEDNETVYKLQYRVDGTVGMVKITEIVAEDGTVTYDYLIVEAGQERHVEKEEPHSKGFDDDEDEDDSEDETETETETETENEA